MTIEAFGEAREGVCARVCHAISGATEIGRGLGNKGEGALIE